MRIKIVLVAAFCLLLSVGAVSAQEKLKDFSGDWEMDTSKSEMSERSRIESMTMKVAQTKTDLTIEANLKRAEVKNERDMARRGRFGGGRALQGDGTQSTIYKLNGEETLIGSAGPFGGDTKFKAESLNDGKLKLIQTRRIESPRGERTMITTEIWELSSDGKTLKVVRDTETPRGNQSSEMVFTKK